jgi:hypothetical protein
VSGAGHDDLRADLGRRVLLAARGAGADLAPLVNDGAEEVLRSLVANPALEEDDLLLVLRRPDLGPELLRQVAADAARTRSYPVRLALVRHPRTPPSSSLKFVAHLHLFDLVAVSLVPHLPREIKAAAEGAILQQLKQLPLGVRVTLARRTTSEAVLSRLLADRETRVVEAALANARLTEGVVVRAVRDASAPPHAIDLVSRNARWSVRHDVRFALVRNRHTPLARSLQFVQSLARHEVRDLARDPSVPAQLRAYLARVAK